MSYAVIAAIWLSVGFVDAGFSYAYLQRQYPSLAEEGRTRDTVVSCLFILFGPPSLFCSACKGWLRHGWLFPGAKP
jgi:hypothetical protein